MKTLIELYNISSPSGKEEAMAAYLTKKLEDLGCKVSKDMYGNIYAVKGKATTYPCVVAHMDEVHTAKPSGFRVVSVAEMLFGIDIDNNRFSGIGADDKNGIWIALKCLEKFDIMKVAFFVQEETGCGGSSRCDMNFFDDCRFVLQCDRKNGSNIISNACGTELCSKEFLEDLPMKKFGYSTTEGLMTDVYMLKTKGLNVSCINISCGYYNPHTDNEYTVKSELYNCLSFVEEVIETMVDVYPHTYTPKYIYGRWGESVYGYTPYDDVDYKGSRWGSTYDMDDSELGYAEFTDSEIEAIQSLDEVGQYLKLIEFIVEWKLSDMQAISLYSEYEYVFDKLSYEDFETALDDVVFDTNGCEDNDIF